MCKEKPTVDNCNRLLFDETDIPEEYDKMECQDCTNFNCVLMPNAEQKEEEFIEGELDSMLPDGIDDGYNFSDFGED